MVFIDNIDEIGAIHKPCGNVMIFESMAPRGKSAIFICPKCKKEAKVSLVK